MPSSVFASLLLALAAAFCLAGCKDDSSDDVTPTPSPTPVVTPSPTPSDNSGGGDGSGGGDVTPTPTPDPGGGGTSSGAAMPASQENVLVTTFARYGASDSVIYVDRSNGERWVFFVDGIPNTFVGDTITFQSDTLVFGDSGGVLLIPNESGATYTYRTATRVL